MGVWFQAREAVWGSFRKLWEIGLSEEMGLEMAYTGYSCLPPGPLWCKQLPPPWNGLFCHDEPLKQWGSSLRPSVSYCHCSHTEADNKASTSAPLLAVTDLPEHKLQPGQPGHYKHPRERKISPGSQTESRPLMFSLDWECDCHSCVHHVAILASLKDSGHVVIHSPLSPCLLP